MNAPPFHFSFFFPDLQFNLLFLSTTPPPPVLPPSPHPTLPPSPSLLPFIPSPYYSSPISFSPDLLPPCSPLKHPSMWVDFLSPLFDA